MRNIHNMSGLLLALHPVPTVLEGMNPFLLCLWYMEFLWPGVVKVLF